MNVLVMNCSPVRNGATAEIVNIVTACLEKKHDVKNIWNAGEKRSRNSVTV